MEKKTSLSLSHASLSFSPIFALFVLSFSPSPFSNSLFLSLKSLLSLNLMCLCLGFFLCFEASSTFIPSTDSLNSILIFPISKQKVILNMNILAYIENKTFKNRLEDRPTKGQDFMLWRILRKTVSQADDQGYSLREEFMYFSFVNMFSVYLYLILAKLLVCHHYFALRFANIRHIVIL